jgi:NAD+ diphosphatase
MLLVPPDIPDSRAYEPVPVERIRGAFGALPLAAVPALSAEGDILTADVPPERALPALWHALHPRQAVTEAGTVPAHRLFRAYHITQWRRESVFCGKCGSKNLDSTEELARVCPSCGRHEYPRISPAIIVLIINDKDEALLAHNKSFAPGVYSLIAGFSEAGETLEMTVAREVREEVGLAVRNIRYMTSQPWPFPNSLMLGFTARYAGGDIRADGVEIEDARWFRRDALPDLPARGSVSRSIVDLWLQGAPVF